MANPAVQFEPVNPPVTLTLVGARAVYEPSVYGGDGSEIRKNLVLEVTPDIIREIRGHEAKIDPSRLCSCIKEETMKCKINMEKVRVFDHANAPQPLPVTWRDQTMNVVVLLKGHWSTKKLAGLSLEATDVQLTFQTHAKSPFAECPPEGTLRTTRVY